MKRCRTCLYPDSKPDLYFDESGECSACINYRNRPSINWEARKKDLLRLLDRHEGRVIVPSSGGKDSTYIVMTLLELGADVTIVTARTCMLTDIGRRNIDNLARYARTIEVVPNMTVRAKLNRLGQELVGDISLPEHMAIFSTPFNVAADIGIDLMFYGENSQDCYGGPPGSEEARQLTRRWVSEYGGHLGLRAPDLIGMQGITRRDMQDYMLSEKAKETSTLEAHFLGQYLPWDSRENAETAVAAGMQYELPTESNWWGWENLDNAQTSIHDFFGFLKYGYGRGCAQVSVDIRSGRYHRDIMIDWLKRYDGHYPWRYAGVPLGDILARIGVDDDWFHGQIRQWTNRELFDLPDEPDFMPKLKDWGC